MELFPAIDLRGGRVVQLVQGDFDRERDHGDDPVSVAQAFVAAGATWIHTVDLDAARTGEAANRHLIAAIAAAVDVPVQAGGGIRSIDAARALRDAGVARVVLGTAALEAPELVAEIAAGQRGRPGPRRAGPRGRGPGMGRGVRGRLGRCPAAARRPPGPRPSSSPRSRSRASWAARTWPAWPRCWPPPTSQVVASGGVGTLADLARARRHRGRRTTAGRRHRGHGDLRGPTRCGRGRRPRCGGAGR